MTEIIVGVLTIIEKLKNIIGELTLELKKSEFVL